MASALSVLFLAFVAVLCVFPVAVKADDKADYGTVIGIGELNAISFWSASSLSRV
jgi:hypothetical protein